MRWPSLTAASLANLASANRHPLQKPSGYIDAATASPADVGQPGFGKLEYFDQLIDHSNPSLGTFKQRYWWNIDHYGGPHSPISMDAPVEGAFAIDGNITSMTSAILPGLLAEDNGAALIRIEHRYFGKSTPYNVSNAETLQHLNIDNAIQDLIYFANNVDLPFDKTNGSATRPDKAPWLLSGCSYAGALTAWTEALAPGTFWAYEAGSAPIQSFGAFWQYFEPIKNAMPKNCSTDMQRIIKHVDQVLVHGSDANKTALKSKFGLQDASDKDFANSLSEWMRIQQSHHVSDKINPLHISCDYLENQRPTVTAPFPGSDGVGLGLAMDGLARLMGENPPEPFELDLWWWFLCNEPFESWQAWDPLDTTGLVSRLFNRADSIQEVCEANFPDFNGFKYRLKEGKNYHTHNKHTGGWRNVNSTRLVWVNGENDPWRPATVSSDSRPGGPLQSTDKVPVYVIKDGGHCNDYRTKDEPTEQGKPVYDAIRQHFRTWVAEFYEEHPGLK